MSVVCPSLAYANTMFFNSAYNVQVLVDDNEPEEKLLGRFRREVIRVGIIQECERCMFHENKQDEKKRKTREAKRNRRRRPMARNGFPDGQIVRRFPRTKRVAMKRITGIFPVTFPINRTGFELPIFKL